MTIKRALLSVSDKSGLAELAAFLHARGVEMLSTGGTAKFLADAGIPVIPIAEWTGFPEILGGRVKTLTPRVFGGILFDRDNDSHLQDCASSGIGAIDLVVVNLYPFEKTVAREGVTDIEAIEQIDVGGPSMLRAAAKNYRHVLPLCSPSLYDRFMMEEATGNVSPAFRREAAIEVFRKTAAYDSAIASFLAIDNQTAQEAGVPERLMLSLEKAQDLRYGENPQQQAGFFRETGSALSWKQHHGKELSYNNLLDLDAALRIAGNFNEPACTIIKHTNPCGTATSSTLSEAIAKALESDPVSAFGGIVGVNRPFEAEDAEILSSLFLEVIVAPSFSESAMEILARRKNLRLVTSSGMTPRFDLKSAAGGYLLQSSDSFAPVASWRVVTDAKPDALQQQSLSFAWNLAAFVKSNTIILARGTQSAGIGAGQMSRVDAARIAVMKSVLPTEQCVAASDAFFPFRDGLDLLIDAGVRAVVQPGGSVRDDEVIAAANERGIAMVFTGERHFRH